MQILRLFEYTCVVTVHISDVTYTNWFLRFFWLSVFGRVKKRCLILDFSGHMHHRTLRLFVIILWHSLSDFEKRNELM